MIQDLTLRWVVTALFAFSAAECGWRIISGRRSGSSVVGHSLHAIMAVAMAVMAWPRGAALPTTAPMVFFALAALWFTVVAAREAAHRGANIYHALMMLAMSWMYAAMGGLPLRRAAQPAEMAGMDMGAAGAGHGGHAGHSGHGGGGGHSDLPAWAGTLNWICAIGFAAAFVYWLYRFVAARVGGPAQSVGHHVGILCQAAMAAGMAIMFAVML
jgi:hypothetical protein